MKFYIELNNIPDRIIANNQDMTNTEEYPKIWNGYSIDKNVEILALFNEFSTTYFINQLFNVELNEDLLINLWEEELYQFNNSITIYTPVDIHQIIIDVPDSAKKLIGSNILIMEMVEEELDKKKWELEVVMYFSEKSFYYDQKYPNIQFTVKCYTSFIKKNIIVE